MNRQERKVKRLVRRCQRDYGVDRLVHLVSVHDDGVTWCGLLRKQKITPDGHEKVIMRYVSPDTPLTCLSCLRQAFRQGDLCF